MESRRPWRGRRGGRGRFRGGRRGGGGDRRGRGGIVPCTRISRNWNGAIQNADSVADLRSLFRRICSSQAEEFVKELEAKEEKDDAVNRQQRQVDLRMESGYLALNLDVSHRHFEALAELGRNEVCPIRSNFDENTPSLEKIDAALREIERIQNDATDMVIKAEEELHKKCGSSLKALTPAWTSNTTSLPRWAKLVGIVAFPIAVLFLGWRRL